MAKKKIYLSAAAHASDNPTKCPFKCGENVHANQYMDIVQRRLTELGFSVKRGDPALTGSKAMTARVLEANKWKADIYYVAHTNAGGGRYSVTYSYPNTASVQKAALFGKYRKALEAHNGYKWRKKTNKSWYEMNATSMVCLYDELFFHDNAEDCRWFHNGGMEQMAEEAVQGLCAVCGVSYAPVVSSAPAATPAPTASTTSKEVPAPSVPASSAKPAKPATPAAPKAGDKVVLKNATMYVSSTAAQGVSRTGTYYVYDGKKIRGRYRVTNRPDRVGKTPVGENVSGWVVL